MTDQIRGSKRHPQKAAIVPFSTNRARRWGTRPHLQIPKSDDLPETEAVKSRATAVWRRLHAPGLISGVLGSAVNQTAADVRLHHQANFLAPRLRVSSSWGPSLADDFGPH